MLYFAGMWDFLANVDIPAIVGSMARLGLFLVPLLIVILFILSKHWRLYAMLWRATYLFILCALGVCVVMVLYGLGDMAGRAFHPSRGPFFLLALFLAALSAFIPLLRIRRPKIEENAVSICAAIALVIAANAAIISVADKIYEQVIAVQVVDTEGKPLSNVEIKLGNGEGQAVGKTDADGKFVMSFNMNSPQSHGSVGRLLMAPGYRPMSVVAANERNYGGVMTRWAYQRSYPNAWREPAMTRLRVTDGFQVYDAAGKIAAYDKAQLDHISKLIPWGKVQAMTVILPRKDDFTIPSYNGKKIGVLLSGVNELEWQFQEAPEESVTIEELKSPNVLQILQIKKGERSVRYVNGHLDLSRLDIGDDIIVDVLSRTANDVKEIDLSRTLVTDRGLATLPTLSLLERIDVSYTKVTTEGLRQLDRHPNLVYGAILGTQATCPFPSPYDNNDPKQQIHGCSFYYYRHPK